MNHVHPSLLRIYSNARVILPWQFINNSIQCSFLIRANFQVLNRWYSPRKKTVNLPAISRTTWTFDNRGRSCSPPPLTDATGNQSVCYSSMVSRCKLFWNFSVAFFRYFVISSFLSCHFSAYCLCLFLVSPLCIIQSEFVPFLFLFIRHTLFISVIIAHPLVS